MLSAAKLLEYWGIVDTLPPLVFYGLVPWLLLLCNMLWVDVSWLRSSKTGGQANEILNRCTDGLRQLEAY
jgi:hypothetical protein